MGFKSRIPEIVQQASVRTQKAVEFAGQEIEFDARRRARKRTGDMAAGIQWKPSRTNGRARHQRPCRRQGLQDALA
jgi:hypothetical protein